MYVAWSILLLQLTTSVALAMPPEGVENYAVLNRGMATSGLSAVASYNNPIWVGDYENLETIGNIPLGEDLLTIGGRATVGNHFGDRTAYFARYDYMFGELNSLSLKWAHEDWKYISTSKDALGAEYNHLWSFMDKGGIYVSVGANYRYIKQRWNSPWWAPLNTNTKDREWYFVGALGFKIPLGLDNFITIDANTRDAWAYYGLDNVAFDGKLYMGSRGFYFTIMGGIRTTATWVGTMNPSNIYGGIGFVVF